MEVKCIGCAHLKREVISLEGRELVVYDCSGHFPYKAALSGLLRPSLGIREASANCSEYDFKHCILCETKTDFVRFGIGVAICMEHSQAWGTWLDERPSKRGYIAPHGRTRKDRWIEIFREFIEDARKS